MTAEEMETAIKASAEESKEQKAEIEKLRTEVAGAETSLQEQKQRTGDALKEMRENGGTPKEVLDRITKIEDTTLNNEEGSSTNPGNEGKVKPKTLEEMQTDLVDSAQGNPAMEEAWTGMEQADRDAIYKDPVQLKAFLQAASEENETPAPGSLIEAAKKNERPDKGQLVEQMRQHFRNEADKSSQLPGNRKTGGTIYKDISSKNQQAQGTEERSLDDGIIPRPATPA